MYNMIINAKVSGNKASGDKAMRLYYIVSAGLVSTVVVLNNNINYQPVKPAMQPFNEKLKHDETSSDVSKINNLSRKPSEHNDSDNKVDQLTTKLLSTNEKLFVTNQKLHETTEQVAELKEMIATQHTTHITTKRSTEQIAAELLTHARAYTNNLTIKDMLKIQPNSYFDIAETQLMKINMPLLMVSAANFLQTAASDCKKIVILAGQAGNGKSTFLKYMASQPEKILVYMLFSTVYKACQDWQVISEVLNYISQQISAQGYETQNIIFALDEADENLKADQFCNVIKQLPNVVLLGNIGHGNSNIHAEELATLETYLNQPNNKAEKDRTQIINISPDLTEVKTLLDKLSKRLHTLRGLSKIMAQSKNQSKQKTLNKQEDAPDAVLSIALPHLLSNNSVSKKTSLPKAPGNTTGSPATSPSKATSKNIGSQTSAITIKSSPSITIEWLLGKCTTSIDRVKTISEIVMSILQQAQYVSAVSLDQHNKFKQFTQNDRNQLTELVFFWADLALHARKQEKITPYDIMYEIVDVFLQSFNDPAKYDKIDIDIYSLRARRSAMITANDPKPVCLFLALVILFLMFEYMSNNSNWNEHKSTVQQPQVISLLERAVCRPFQITEENRLAQQQFFSKMLEEKVGLKS